MSRHVQAGRSAMLGMEFWILGAGTDWDTYLFSDGGIIRAESWHLLIYSSAPGA
jgi:hypothetical protein